ncbi:MAG: hypothetical protein QM737_12685 [Ferruginibacter sp.]
MKKQTNNSSNANIRVNNKKTANKPHSRNMYTEADLGEDILNVSLCSVYTAAKQLVSNIQNRSYVFHY